MAILLSTSSFAHADAPRLFDFQDITLENGLRVITLEDFSSPIVAVQVWYGVGSKDEDSERQGFAHMFEHMMFRGTERLGPEEHFSLIRKTGGDCNAFTSFDHTAYINQLPSNQLELALWLEAERLMYLKVDQPGFDTERKVVEEERRMGINEPYGTVLEQGLPIVFRQHPYRWSPIGNIPMLRQAKVSELQQFWDRWYVPSNATLVIVGGVKHADAQTLARKYFAWMPSGKIEDRPTQNEPAQTEGRKVTIKEAVGPVPLVAYVYRGVPVNHPDAIPLQLMTIVLGVGESSRLNVDLVRAKQQAAQAQSEYYWMKDDGLFGVGAILNQGIEPAVMETALDGHLAALVEKGIEARELEKAKNRLRRDIVTNMLTVASKARQIGDATLAYGTPDRLNTQLAEINAVTLDDIARVAKTYVVPERRTVFRIIPDAAAVLPNEDAAPVTAPETEPAKRTGAKAGVDRPKDLPVQPPTNAPLDDLPLPSTSEKTLPNGLRVVVVPNNELPYVTVLCGTKFGSWAEDSSVPGVASAALSLLTKGTEKYTADELAELIEFNALTIDGRASLDVSQVSVTALSDKLPLAFELLAEVVRRPTFPAKELDLLKQQRTVSLSVNEEDVNYVVDREVRRKLFGAHPYSRNVDGELADVPRLSQDAVATFWRTYARPDTITLYFAGDIETDAAVELAEKYFGEWKVEGPAPDVTAPGIPKTTPTHIYLVDKPGAVQSQIRVAQVSITRSDPAYHFARVFSQIFGGAFDSRLNKTIRIERGLTYGAGGGFYPSRFAGRFLSSTFTKTESTAETVQALLDVINGMRSTPPTEDELSTARAYLTGSFPADLETPQDAVNYQWMIESSELPKDYLRQAMQSYRQASQADVRNIAENVIDPAALTIVVAGEAEKLKESLGKIAPVTVIAASPTAEKNG
ncbi:MAG: pitrilysin family protein [Candidatus Hydrogenedentes bacterium]|nr:pitrilysin family protein [Candidatus Hydrogenedentota bacterium]